MTTKRPPGEHSLIRTIGNWCVAALLRSPLHGLIDRHMMLLSFTGRKSGRTYTIPVSYARDGDTLIVISQSDRSWWRNLRGGAPVRMRVQGSELAGYAESSETPKAVAAGLLALSRQIPAFRRQANIALDADGQPERPDDLLALARGRVIVRIADLVVEQAGQTYGS